MRTLTTLSLLVLAAGSSSPVLAQRYEQGPNRVMLPFPTGRAETVNIVQWDANTLPKIYERTDQLPLSNEEIVKMSKAGFDTPELVKMIEQRRCACDASADGLIRMKKEGVHKDVIAAVSTHALQPNRALDLSFLLDFTGESNQARESHLYLFIDDGDITRVFTANINDLLSRRYSHEEMLDKSDLLLARKVRRVTLPGQVPLKTYGKHTAMVVASANPALTHPSQLTPAERASAQLYTFEYPRSSVQSVCWLTAGYKRDAVLAHKWRLMGSRFECEWN